MNQHVPISDRETARVLYGINLARQQVAVDPLDRAKNVTGTAQEVTPSMLKRAALKLRREVLRLRA